MVHLNKEINNFQEKIDFKTLISEPFVFEK